MEEGAVILDFFVSVVLDYGSVFVYLWVIFQAKYSSLVGGSNETFLGCQPPLKPIEEVLSDFVYLKYAAMF
jgi:hypothetical protein